MTNLSKHLQQRILIFIFKYAFDVLGPKNDLIFGT